MHTWTSKTEKQFFLKTIVSLGNIFLVEFLLQRCFPSYFNVIMAIKQWRVALFPWQLWIQRSFQLQGAYQQCAPQVFQLIPSAIGSQLGPRMGSEPQGKSLLTEGCLSGYFMHIVFFYVCVPKWQRLRSTVLKYIMNQHISF